jgi:hypothetical protein
MSEGQFQGFSSAPGQSVPPPPPPPGAMGPSFGGPPLQPPPGFGGPGSPPRAPRAGIPPLLLGALGGGLLVLAGVAVLYASGVIGPHPPTPPPSVIGKCPPDCTPITRPPDFPTAPPATLGTAPPNASALVGQWLRQTVPPNACGEQSLTFWINADQTWRSQQLSPNVPAGQEGSFNCGDVSLGGQYTVTGSSIAFHIEYGPQGCEVYRECVALLGTDIDATFQFIDNNTVNFCGGDGCFLYYRQ